jgi:hypothetical protein
MDRTRKHRASRGYLCLHGAFVMGNGMKVYGETKREITGSRF